MTPVPNRRRVSATLLGSSGWSPGALSASVELDLQDRAHVE